MRVLLLDDDEANRLTMGGVLEDAGYEVVEVRSVADARVAIARGAYDLAILDVHLSDGLGTDLLSELRQRFPAIRLAVLSGSLSSQSVPGADLVLAKASDPAEILARLAQVLAARG
jgi:CheY-like chemotaxis protein